MIFERKNKEGKEENTGGRKGEREGRRGGKASQPPSYSAPALPTKQWGEQHLMYCPPFENLDMVHQVNVVGRIKY